MLAIISIQFLATFGQGQQTEMIVSLLQIVITCLSIMSGMTSLSWKAEPKGVDIKLISSMIEGRKQSIENKKHEESLLASIKPTGSKKKASLRKAKLSSEDTDNSNADSAGLGDVLEELEHLLLDDIVMSSSALQRKSSTKVNMAANVTISPRDRQNSVVADKRNNFTRKRSTSNAGNISDRSSGGMKTSLSIQDNKSDGGNINILLPKTIESDTNFDTLIKETDLIKN